MAYRFLPHTADVRVALESGTLAGLFQDGVAALRTLLVGDSPVEPSIRHQVTFDISVPEDALLALLREILVRYETDGFVPAEARIDAGEAGELTGVLLGEPFDRARHAPEPEVKAVTRHGLTVRPAGTGWYAEIVFDL